MDALLQHEPVIRLGFFLGMFAVMAAWELLAPRRVPGVSKAWRWTNNLGIVFLNTALVRVVFPTTAVALALSAEANGWGVLNHLALPAWLEIAIAVAVLDMAIWLQHVMFHAVPALWRLHRVHHADLDYDLTTGARFHPIEILLSMLIKLAAILMLGPPAVAVLIFEVVLNATAMFNHGNVRMPLAFDRLLRLVVVTPDMHRVHHSIEARETNSNFGFNLSVWDRLFGTYKAQPDAGHERMTIGIREHRDEREVDRLPGMLALPFRGAVSDYAINRRSWETKA